MKKRQLIFFGVLIASIFILAACQYLQPKPGKAIAVPTAGDEETIAAPIGGFCANAGQNCGRSTANNLSCCSGLNCQFNPSVKQWRCVASTCTPQTSCSGSYLNTTLANCTKTSTLCQYGCSNGQCLPPPQQNCTPSTICVTSNVLNTTLSNCTGYYTNCQYGCSNGQCNGAPSNCTPTCIDHDNGINLNFSTGLNVTFSNCTKSWFGDYCVSSNQAYEYYCSGNTPTGNVFTCPAGQTCVNGACQ